jgi:hypothetical protein
MSLAYDLGSMGGWVVHLNILNYLKAMAVDGSVKITAPGQR